MGAILANASLAAMDIADGGSAPTIAPLLEELEVSTRLRPFIEVALRASGRARRARTRSARPSAPRRPPQRSPIPPQKHFACLPKAYR